jgi:anaerobic selenocysteine-containing dehydrogenase
MAKVFTVVNIMEHSSTLINKFRSSNDAQNGLITQTVIAIAEHFMVKIDPEIVQRLGIRDGDIVSQIEDGTGIIRLIFKETKNKSRPKISQNPIDKDYGE